MAELSQTFSGQTFRIIENVNEKRLSATDCCAALGYSDPKDSWKKIKGRNPELAELVRGDSLSTLTGTYTIDTLNMEGVANLCMLAKTEKAQDFRRWAREILASEIEKKNEIELPHDYLSALKALVSETEKTIGLKAHLAIAEPKAESFDLLMNSDGYYDVDTAAKIAGTGRNRLYKKYLEWSWAWHDGEHYHAYQSSVERGLLVMKSSTYKRGNRTISYPIILVTQAGLDLTCKKLKAETNG